LVCQVRLHKSTHKCALQSRNRKQQKAAAYKQNKKEDSDAGDHLYAPFVESVKKVLKEKADIEICEEKFYTENKDVQSLGIACVVNFFGRIKGKFLIDMKRTWLCVGKKHKGRGF